MSLTRRLLLGVGMLAIIGRASAQQPAASPGPAEEELPPIIDSRSGYVDSAIPANVLRFRYDAAYNDNNPLRGEFFYANNGPNTHGLPLDESNVNYQDLSLYAEHRFGQRLSTFIEVPFRFVNFEQNADHSGFGDMNAGGKFSLLYSEENVLTAQFRGYAPTGNAREGLGNHHVSLEPALLWYHKWTDRLASESELRYWQPVGGTPDVEGSLIRYGTGIHFDAVRTCNWTIAPVIEVVGWTFLNGEKDPPFAAEAVAPNQSAAGDTIVNLKVGIRFKLNDRGDVYLGYGRALTGDVLYKDIYRLELRLPY